MRGTIIYIPATSTTFKSVFQFHLFAICFCYTDICFSGYKCLSLTSIARIKTYKYIIFIVFENLFLKFMKYE